MHFDLTAGGQRIFSILHNGKAPNYIMDGMTNDVDGNLYIATFRGNKIIQFNPR